MDKKLTLPPPKKPGRRSKADKIALQTSLLLFADGIKIIQKTIDEKVSSRGWAYLIENFGLIDKSQFDYVQGLINECRKNGMLPLDFVAADEARAFKFVEELDIETKTSAEYLNGYLRWLANSAWKQKDDVTFWKTQTHYIQMMVEKIDVLNLFKPVCEKYHIPIANAKGWSDLISRGKIAKRYKESERNDMLFRTGR